MADLVKDIADWLQSQNYGTDGVNIFRDYSPETPDQVICIYEYSSRPAAHDNSADRYIQVTVRDKSTTEAKEVAWKIYSKLINNEDGRVNFSNDRWCLVRLQRAPIKMKIDNKNRTVWGFNTRMTTYNDY